MGTAPQHVVVELTLGVFSYHSVIYLGCSTGSCGGGLPAGASLVGAYRHQRT